MTLPSPHEWQVSPISLTDACRRLYPFAYEWRETVYASESLNGVFENDADRAEYEALGAFLAACRAVGLDK